jgi:hypothetical protein
LKYISQKRKTKKKAWTSRLLLYKISILKVYGINFLLLLYIYDNKKRRGRRKEEKRKRGKEEGEGYLTKES